MFLLDSLMISGIQWALQTALTAAEAEMNDDSVLRDRLLEAEMQREMGEISDDEFAAVETDLLQAIREIKERREGSGPLAFGSAQPIEAGADVRFEVEAEVSGEFYGQPELHPTPDTAATLDAVAPPARKTKNRTRSDRTARPTAIRAHRVRRKK